MGLDTVKSSYEVVLRGMQQHRQKRYEEEEEQIKQIYGGWGKGAFPGGKGQQSNVAEKHER